MKRLKKATAFFALLALTLCLLLAGCQTNEPAKKEEIQESTQAQESDASLESAQPSAFRLVSPSGHYSIGLPFDDEQLYLTYISNPEIPPVLSSSVNPSIFFEYTLEQAKIVATVNGEKAFTLTPVENGFLFNKETSSESDWNNNLPEDGTFFTPMKISYTEPMIPIS